MCMGFAFVVSGVVTSFEKKQNMETHRLSYRAEIRRRLHGLTLNVLRSNTQNSIFTW